MKSLILFLGLMLAGLSTAPAQPLVIAHRGAAAYLPEHSLASMAMAHAQGADFIEQDLVLSRDGVPVVLHDLTLEAVSDVAAVFPDRARDDGRYYVIDFDLTELRQLGLHERRDPSTGAQVFPERFPAEQALFGIVTLAEAIALVQGLNRSTGRDVGIYPEIKFPHWHREQGQDISEQVLAVLDEHGYNRPEANIYLQGFDWDETRRLRGELGWRGPLIQLLGENRWAMGPTDYEYLKTLAGLAEIATVADGIGPWINQLIGTTLAADARAQGLTLHPYTLRADRVPDFATDFEALQRFVFIEHQADGAFTDFPDLTLEFLQREGLRGVPDRDDDQ